MKIFTWIVAIIVMILGISFAMLNADPVKLNYYLGTSDISLSLLLVLVLLIGMLIGVMVTLSKVLKLKMSCRRYRHQIEHLQTQIKS